MTAGVWDPESAVCLSLRLRLTDTHTHGEELDRQWVSKVRGKDILRHTEGSRGTLVNREL